MPPLFAFMCTRTRTSSSKISLELVDCWPDVYQASMFRFKNTRVQGESLANILRAMSGTGYLPHSLFTNERGGPQMPSAFPSPHLSGMAVMGPCSVVGAGAAFSGAGSAEALGSADSAGAAVVAGSLAVPPQPSAIEASTKSGHR